MLVRLLGPTDVWSDGRSAMTSGAAKIRQVIAVLAVARERLVHQDGLVDALWPNGPPASANKTLQTYVWTLRRSLGSDFIVTDGAHYRLGPGVDVDVDEFEAAVSWAADAVQDDRLENAVEVLDGALALWRGVALVDVLDWPAACAEAVRLEELRCYAEELRAGALARLHRDGAAIGELEFLALSEPLRERRWELLVSALIDAGRSGEAARAVHRAREHFVESGLELGPELRRLEIAALRHEATGVDSTTPTSSRVSTRALLFTDIEGSTALIQRLGERYAGVLERHQRLIRSAAASRSGVEESSDGDSLFITFPTASAAIAGALDAQRRIEHEHWTPDGLVRVRMGLHVGEVAETPAGLVGLAIHQATRVTSAAHGGQIVVTGDVVQQAGVLPEDVTMRSLGSYDLRDVGRVVLYQIDHPDLQSEFPALRTKRAVAHNLPAPLTSLVGRVAEAAAVSALVDEHRLVTLLGEGGCGKTRLALRVADAAIGRFVDGVWFVDLAPLSTGDDITDRVAHVLGVHGGLDELVTALQQRQVLLVLDNCENVVQSTAALLTTLLGGSVTTRVVATSRAPLEVAGEARYKVPPLAVPRRGADLNEAQATDAVRLFIARAGLVRPGYELGQRDVEAIVELCTRLDGLPLAIELAAAQLRGMSLGELVSRVDDRFGLLVGGPSSAPTRHQTLRNAVAWSFRLLDADERHVLRHLCVFRGGCDLESAECVCGTGLSSPDGVLAVLIRLVDKSLVTAGVSDEATRYLVHETIRDYALASVSDADRDSTHERHARWFATLASRLGEGPLPGGEREWIRRHDIERDNLRAAAEWLVVHDPPAALGLLVAVEAGMDLTSQPTWCVDAIRRVLPLADDASVDDRAQALSLLAWDASEAGGPTAPHLLGEAVELLGDVENPAVECSVLSAVAKCHADATGGQLDGNEVAAAIAAADRKGGTYWPIMARYYLSWKASPSIAEALTTDALRLADRLGMGLFGDMMRRNLAIVGQFTGDSPTVLATWRPLVPMLNELAMYEWGDAYYYPLAEAEHGDLPVAVHLAEHLLLRLTSGPHDPTLAAGLNIALAHIRRLAGDLQGAQVALDAAGRAGTPTRDFIGRLAIVTQSALCRQRGQPHSAAAVIEQACEHVGFRGLTDIPIRIVEELAAVAVALGRPQDGSDLLATARHARELDHRPLSSACRAEVDAVQARLGELQGTSLTASEVRSLASSLVNAPPK